ncbi:MAG: hypothetical protein J6V06_03455 [Clostridia bacterium]|nr:hypothetical protein [Clostridia bacterium]MBO7319060.1 hypothetical protein [Clostridia bacterium]
MKYELKRQININMICYCAPLVIGLCALVAGEILAFIILLLIGVGLMVNEIIRSKKDEKLIFDENGFHIGDTPYRYDSIEKIESNRWRYLVWVRIIVDGNIVYKFDNSYENYKEFAKQLTLHGVDHNLFS